MVHTPTYSVGEAHCVRCDFRVVSLYLMQGLQWSRKDFMFIRKLGTGRYGEIFLMQTKVGSRMLHFSWRAVSHSLLCSNCICFTSRLG